MDATARNPMLRAGPAALVGLLAVLAAAVWTNALPRPLIEQVRSGSPEEVCSCVRTC